LNYRKSRHQKIIDTNIEKELQIRNPKGEKEIYHQFINMIRHT